MPRKQSYEHVVDNSIKEIGRMGFQSEVTNGFKNGGGSLFITLTIRGIPPKVSRIRSSRIPLR